MLDFDRKPPAFAADDRSAQLVDERRRVEGRGHHHQLHAGEQPLRQREGEIAGQVALVEFVEHDRAHPGQLRVGEHPAGEDAFGHVPEARPRRAPLLEAHLPADQAGIVELLGDALRGRARRETARLQDDDFSVHEVEQGGRDTRGLARSGRRLQHQGRPGSQRREDVRQRVVDGQSFLHGGGL